MTVVGKIGKTHVNFLVDSGASCSMISDAVYKRLCNEAEDYQLGVLSDRKFQLADGTPLATQGKLKVDIQLGPVAVTHDVIVGSIYDEGIIGYDFLKTHGCKLNIGNDELQVKGIRVTSCAETENHQENGALEGVELRTTDSVDAVGSAILKIEEALQVDSGSEQLDEVMNVDSGSEQHKEDSGSEQLFEDSGIEQLFKEDSGSEQLIEDSGIEHLIEDSESEHLNEDSGSEQLHEVAIADTLENYEEKKICRMGNPASTSLGSSDEKKENEEKSTVIEDLTEHSQCKSHMSKDTFHAEQIRHKGARIPAGIG